MDAFINAIAYYLPEKVVTNEDISRRFPEWTVEKINSKIGIFERHVAAEGETASDMAVLASNMLFDAYNIDRKTVDFVLFCTQSADYFLPSSACLIQNKLNLSVSVGALDINLGCSGFLYGLALAKGLIASEMARNVLLLTSETYSKYIHPLDKGNQTIFGDAAAATLVSVEGCAKIGHFSFGTDGGGANNLMVKTGAARHKSPAHDLRFDGYGNPISSDHLYMDGAAIVNFTLEHMPSLATNLLMKHSLTLSDIDLFVFHQANKYIMELLRKKLRIEKEKYYCFYANVGNTVSSTIPIALLEAGRCNAVRKGDKVMMTAPGLGYSWAGTILFIENNDGFSKI
jgi:3-oxoacyl-[acyl-carrier-protein] synthase-3